MGKIYNIGDYTTNGIKNRWWMKLALKIDASALVSRSQRQLSAVCDLWYKDLSCSAVVMLHNVDPIPNHINLLRTLLKKTGNDQTDQTSPYSRWQLKNKGITLYNWSWSLSIFGSLFRIFNVGCFVASWESKDMLSLITKGHYTELIKGEHTHVGNRRS